MINRKYLEYMKDFGFYILWAISTILSVNLFRQLVEWIPAKILFCSIAIAIEIGKTYCFVEFKFFKKKKEECKTKNEKHKINKIMINYMLGFIVSLMISLSASVGYATSEMISSDNNNELLRIEKEIKNSEREYDLALKQLENLVNDKTKNDYRTTYDQYNNTVNIKNAELEKKRAEKERIIKDGVSTSNIEIFNALGKIFGSSSGENVRSIFLILLCFVIEYFLILLAPDEIEIEKINKMKKVEEKIESDIHRFVKVMLVPGSNRLKIVSELVKDVGMPREKILEIRDVISKFKINGENVLKQDGVDWISNFGVDKIIEFI